MSLIVFYLIDWGFLTTLWTGVSPCMTPGQGDCVVWWDAWAVVVGGSAVAIAVAALIVAWVGIGVTTASAFAVWKLGVTANYASAEATRIAKQQHDAEMKLREENARIIGRLLLNEVSQVPIRVAAIYRACVAAIAWDGHAKIVKENALRFMLQETADTLFPGAEAVEARIHVLPDGLGADLATLIGAGRTLNDISRRMKGRTTFSVQNGKGKASPARYSGMEDDFAFIRDQLAFIHESSVDFSGDFRKFVGVPPEKYLPISVPPTGPA